MKHLHYFLAAGLLLTMSAGAFSQNQRILAHRGGRTEQEENTIEAFKATYEAGCHGYETDIHITADGELVVMHDSEVARMTDGKGVIEEMTAAQIRALTTKQGNKVPFLNELLDYLKDKENLYVEFELKCTDTKLYTEEKIKEYCDKVYAAVMGSKPADALYVISSFDTRCLRYLQQKYPDTVLMLITGEPCNAEVRAIVRNLGLDRVAARLDGTSRNDIKAAHAMGMKVNLWPGNTVEDTHLAFLLGADYLCTDIPQSVMKHISENNLPIISK